MKVMVETAGQACALTFVANDGLVVDGIVVEGVVAGVVVVKTVVNVGRAKALCRIATRRIK